MRLAFLFCATPSNGNNEHLGRRQLDLRFVECLLASHIGLQGAILGLDGIGISKWQANLMLSGSATYPVELCDHVSQSTSVGSN